MYLGSLINGDEPPIELFATIKYSDISCAEKPFLIVDISNSAAPSVNKVGIVTKFAAKKIVRRRYSINFHFGIASAIYSNCLAGKLLVTDSENKLSVVLRKKKVGGSPLKDNFFICSGNPIDSFGRKSRIAVIEQMHAIVPNFGHCNHDH